MSASQGGAHRFVRQSQTLLLSKDTVCASCLTRLSYQTRRNAASAAATAPGPAASASKDESTIPVTHAGPRKAYRLLASPILSRPPLLTRELTAFEKSFYLYQKRLNERLALPFSRYFYYKKGTPGDVEWKRKARSRKSAARDIGVYSGYGDEAWNDEVLVGDTTAEPANIVEALLRDAEGKDTEQKSVGNADSSTASEVASGSTPPEEGGQQEVGQNVILQKPSSRITAADEQKDVRSLDRRMDRTLYLLVQNKDGRWRFPEDRVRGRESLHQAAERTMIQSLGINMNTWLVGNQPVGYYSWQFPTPVNATVSPNRLVPGAPETVEQEELGEKVFFMKARIMAGKPDLSKNEFGDRDYRWLAKEEIAQVVSPKYWSSVCNMLAER